MPSAEQMWKMFSPNGADMNRGSFEKMFKTIDPRARAKDIQKGWEMAGGSNDATSIITMPQFMELHKKMEARAKYRQNERRGGRGGRGGRKESKPMPPMSYFQNAMSKDDNGNRTLPKEMFMSLI